MSALPANYGQEDSLDAERILRVLPDRERETFLAQYRRAVDGARDPAGWKHLQRFLAALTRLNTNTAASCGT